MMLLPLLLVALQDGSAAEPQDVNPDAREATTGAARVDEIDLFTTGIQAPRQPIGVSSATVRRAPRIQPVPVPNQNVDRLMTRIDSIVAVRGQEDNPVMGIGLVTGLAGTGDSGLAARQLLQNLLLTRNINIPPADLASQNIAVVRVEANIPAGVKPGRRVDVRVSTIGDAESLLGGTLAMTELMDISGAVVYATASGPLTVGGFSAGGAGATATRNHVTVGTMPGGGKVEREVPTRVVSDHGYLYLDMRVAHQSFGNTVRITDRINRLYPGAAHTLPDGKTVKIRVPDDLPEEMHVAYVDSILRQEIVSDNFARVIVNERSGVIVMGGDVRLRPGAIAHGNLTVTIAETPEASQPGAAAGGDTAILDRTTLDVVEDDGAIVLVPGAVTLREVVDVLNILGTSPRDLISILQAMSQGGLLVADIHRM